MSVQATWIQTNASPCCFPPALSETHLQQVVQVNMLQLCYFIPLYIDKQTQLKHIRSEESIKRELTTIYSRQPAQNVFFSVFKSWKSIANIGYSLTAFHNFRFLLRLVYFSLTFWTNCLYQNVTIMSIISTSGLCCSPSMNVVGVISKYELKRIIHW